MGYIQQRFQTRPPDGLLSRPAICGYQMFKMFKPRIWVSESDQRKKLNIRKLAEHPKYRRIPETQRIPIWNSADTRIVTDVPNMTDTICENQQIAPTPNHSRYPKLGGFEFCYRYWRKQNPWWVFVTLLSVIFRDTLQWYKAVTIFKTGNTNDPNNYRPLFILPSC